MTAARNMFKAIINHSLIMYIITVIFTLTQNWKYANVSVRSASLVPKKSSISMM